MRGNVVDGACDFPKGFRSSRAGGIKPPEQVRQLAEAHARMVRMAKLDETIYVGRRTSLEDIDVDARVEQQLATRFGVLVDEGQIGIGASDRSGSDLLGLRRRRAWARSKLKVEIRGYRPFTGAWPKRGRIEMR